MKVNCIHNQIDSFKANRKLYIYLKDTNHIESGKFPLTKGAEYTVYTVVKKCDFLDEPFTHYLICDDEYGALDYPMFYISDFFEVIQDNPSEYWISNNTIRGPSLNHNSPNILTFRDFDLGGIFYERLIDGDPAAIQSFKDAKRLMDAEALKL